MFVKKFQNLWSRGWTAVLGLFNNYLEAGEGGAEKLELSSKNLGSTHPPKQKKIVLAPPLLC